ncbi:MAG: PEP-CTERM sorting domain-containing protein [Deltaproteobacteria bacterium]|nr:PEP-CTERM sorting domain-containing protein [Deltaproteobacteria bacterium]
MIKICFATLIVFFAFFTTANASTITFDSYTNIQSIEDDFNVDFSSLWYLHTDGSTNKVGTFIDGVEYEQSIEFKTNPVLVQSLTIGPSFGKLSGYLNGALVSTPPLLLSSLFTTGFSPATISLMDWGFIDTLVFDSYMVTLDDLTFEPKPTPVPSGLLLLGTGLISFFGVRRRFKS